MRLRGVTVFFPTGQNGHGSEAIEKFVHRASPLTKYTY